MSKTICVSLVPPSPPPSLRTGNWGGVCLPSSEVGEAEGDQSRLVSAQVARDAPRALGALGGQSQGQRRGVRRWRTGD